MAASERIGRRKRQLWEVPKPHRDLPGSQPQPMPKDSAQRPVSLSELPPGLYRVLSNWGQCLIRQWEGISSEGIRKNRRQTLCFCRADWVVLRFQCLSRKKGGKKGRKILLHLRTFETSGYLNQNKYKKQTHTEQTHL